MSPATHSSAPDEKGQERKAHRPEQDEARDRQGDPGRLADIVQSRRDPHSRLLDVNVIYIHINGPTPRPLSSGAEKKIVSPAPDCRRARYRGRAGRPARRPRADPRPTSGA